MSSKPGNPQIQEHRAPKNTPIPLPLLAGETYTQPDSPLAHIAMARVEMLTHQAVSLLVGSTVKKTNILDQQFNTDSNHIHQN